MVKSKTTRREGGASPLDFGLAARVHHAIYLRIWRKFIFNFYFLCVSVRNIKSVPPPTVPLFNPSEIQLGKEDTRTASVTAERNLPSKGMDE